MQESEEISEFDLEIKQISITDQNGLTIPYQKNTRLEDYEMIKVIGRGSIAKVVLVKLRKTSKKIEYYNL